MRIGIMSASLQGEALHENKRLIDEINHEHEAVLINYRRTAVAVTEAGRILYGYDEDDKLTPIEVDAVIPRIGRFVESGVLALRLLTSKGIYSTAPPDAVVHAKDKATTAVLLDSFGIPTPYTITPTGKRPNDPSDTIALIRPDEHRPVIIKKTRGSHGKGVQIADSYRSATSAAESLHGDGSLNPSYIIQEFIDAPQTDAFSSDIRVIIVDGKVVAAMKRVAKDKKTFKSNLSLGAIGEPYELTPREAEIAIKSCEALNLPVAGVDILTSYRGPLVNEVNVSPEFGIERVTGINVPAHIAGLAIRMAEESNRLLS